MISYLLQLRRLRWLPGNCTRDIVIADNGYEYVRECIPDEFSVLYVPMRGEYWYINFSILWRFLRFFAVRRRFSLALRGCYVAAVTTAIGARAIVTMIDNNNWDTGIAEHTDVRIVCIGNGFRRPEHIAGKAFDCYFALNNLPRDASLAFRITARDYRPVGHIKMGIFQSMKSQEKLTNGNVQFPAPYTVWISQYRSYMHDASSGQASPVERDQIEMERIGAAHLSRYASENGLTTRIAHATELKRQTTADEVRFFSRATDGSAVFESYNGDTWGSYRLVDGADLVVGMYSTLLFEALSAGKRVIFFLPFAFRALFQDLARCLPYERVRPLLVSSGAYSDFRQKCDEVRRLSESEYRSVVEDLRTDVASFDDTDLPQYQISRAIGELVDHRGQVVEESI